MGGPTSQRMIRQMGWKEETHKGGEGCDVLEPAYDAVYAIKVTSEADTSHMDITNQLPET